MKRPPPPADLGADLPGPGPAWAPRWELLGLAAGLIAVALVTGWALPDAPAGEAVVLASAAKGAVDAQASAAPLVVASTPPAPPDGRAARPEPVPQAAAPSAAEPAAPARISRQRDPDGDLTPDLADHVNDGELPTMAEVISRLHQAGVTTGLGAFSPPGTRPPRVGLAVPEDFVLPPGYVRHYQATDDGQRIEPILMFAPGAQVLDAEQRPVPLPRDRVVPPELAPPGLPLRQVVVPSAGNTPPGG